MKKILFLCLSAVLLSGSMFAQVELGAMGESDPNAEEGRANNHFRRPRVEDHFWRQRVVNRIDLREKINAPLVYKESAFYTDNSQYEERSGLITALMNGLKSGDFTAYDPDSLKKPMSWKEVFQKFNEYEGALIGDSESLGEESSEFNNFEGDEGFEFEGGGTEGSTDDPLSDPFADPFASPSGSPDDLTGSAEAAAAPAPMSQTADFTSLETVVQFVEDRIFDKVRSDMIYDILFIEIIWTDAGGLVPEQRLCTFKYDEVLAALERTQWKNRFNDAEMRSLREVFELRMFHSYIINVGGSGVRSLPESERRRQKMVEFEHHLWSY